MKTIKIFMLTALMGGVMVSCSNGDSDFPNFEYQTVYFAKPSIGRTIELGRAKDIDLTLDNQHMFEIKCVRGGAYNNKANRIVHYKVDPTLIENLYYTEDWGGHAVEIMPEDYYTILDENMVIPAGRIDGGIKVQLSDKFFEDPKALDFNYVIPLVMTSVEGNDSILQGKKQVENPNRFIDTDWVIAPKDYVVYSVRFVNEWNGHYLRRGVDNITTADGTSAQVVRHAQYIERDEVVAASTTGFRSCDLPLTTQTDADHTYNYTLRLNFSTDGTCTVTSANDALTVSGTGKFLIDSEKKAISGIDRDGLYLDYTVSHADGWSIAATDTLVMRDRNVSAQYPALEVK